MFVNKYTNNSILIYPFYDKAELQTSYVYFIGFLQLFSGYCRSPNVDEYRNAVYI